MDLLANLKGDFNSSAANSTMPSIAGKEEINDIGTLSHISNVIITFLSVVFNGIIIHFLIRHRSKFPEVIFQQTLCLGVTDLVAGFSPATSCLLLIEEFNQSSKVCFFILSLNIGAQFAVMINLTFLSIRRWMILRNVSKPRSNVQNISTKGTLFYLLGPWIITALCMIPMIVIKIISDETTINNRCLSRKSFTENGFAFFYLVLFIISLGILSLFHTCSIIAFKRSGMQNVNVIRSRNQRLQAKAFKHMLTVLIVANITTLPLVINIILSVTNIVRNSHILYLSRSLKVTVTVINPLVYTFHITDLRNVIMKSLSPKSLRMCSCRKGIKEVYTEQTDSPGNHRY